MNTGNSTPPSESVQPANQDLQARLAEAERQLHDANRRNQELAAAIPDGLVRFTPGEVPEFLNPAGERLYRLAHGPNWVPETGGLENAKLANRDPESAAPGNWRIVNGGLVTMGGVSVSDPDASGPTMVGAIEAALCVKVFTTGRDALVEYNLAGPPDGRCIEARYVPERDAGGQMHSVLCILRETTGRKRVKEALRASEQRFRVALGHAGIKVFSQDLNLRCMWVYDQQPGPMNEILPGKTDFEIYPFDEATHLTTLKERVIASGVGTRQEVHVTVNGKRCYYDMVIEPLRDINHAVIGVLCAAADITPRIQAEQELQRLLVENDGQRAVLEQQKNLLQAIFDTDPTGLAVLVGAEMVHEFANPAYHSMTPHPEIDPLGHTYAQVWPQHEKFRGSWLIQRVLENGKPFHIDHYPQQFPDGTTRYFSLDIRPLKWGDHLAVLLVMWDTTRLDEAYLQVEQSAQEIQRQAAEAEEAQRTLEALMAYIPEGIAIADAESGRLRMLSQYGAAMASRPDIELHNLPVDELPAAYQIYHLDGVTPAQPADFPINRAIHDREIILNDEWLLLRDDGQRIHILCNAGPILSARGQVQGGVLAWRDISERKRAEEALRSYARQLERSNQELEQFAFVASHDLQEPLRKIRAFGERLRDHIERDLNPEEVEFLTRMLSASQRMDTMINDLLTYSRVTTKARPFQKVNLNQVAHEVLNDLELRLERGQGRVDLGELPVVEADPLQMRQLLQNLIGNALKFHKKGEIPQVQVSAQPVPGSNLVEIRVVDNGVGFDEQYLERVFKPFERLHGRSEYEGSGMGLAICSKIVERHRGSITASSRPGQGATFIVRLPLKPTV